MIAIPNPTNQKLATQFSSAQPLAFEQSQTQGYQLALPQGIIGFPELNQVEIVYRAEEVPFMRMLEVTDTDQCTEFLVVDPSNVVSNYQIHLSDTDAALLELNSAEDAQIFNIVTLSNSQSPQATVNCVAPIVFNIHTLKGAQVIIENFTTYSAHYKL